MSDDYAGTGVPTFGPPIYMCAECGARWAERHTCPNAPRSTSAPRLCTCNSGTAGRLGCTAHPASPDPEGAQE